MGIIAQPVIERAILQDVVIGPQGRDLFSLGPRTAPIRAARRDGAVSLKTTRSLHPQLHLILRVFGKDMAEQLKG